MQPAVQVFPAADDASIAVTSESHWYCQYEEFLFFSYFLLCSLGCQCLFVWLAEVVYISPKLVQLNRQMGLVFTAPKSGGGVWSWCPPDNVINN